MFLWLLEVGATCGKILLGSSRIVQIMGVISGILCQSVGDWIHICALIQKPAELHMGVI